MNGNFCEGRRAWSVLLACTLLAGGSARAQLPLDGFDGPVAGGDAGRAVAWIDDIDGDGVRDFLVGAPGDSAAGAAAGAAYVLSGADFSVLRAWTGHAPGDQFGAAVAAAGDVDGDGVPDVIIGAAQDPFDDSGWTGNGPGYVQVFSGATGAVLHTWQGECGLTPRFGSFGRAVLGVGDRDRDGHADVAVAERDTAVDVLHGYHGAGGRVWIFSGADGSVLARIEVPSIANGRVGWSLAGGADIDGDGTADLVLGAPQGNRVAIVSGATDELLVTCGTTAATRGFSVDFLGDVDGDAVPDVVVGLRSTSEVYSGATGALIRSSGTYSNTPIHQGVYVAGVPDADGDGVDDYAVGAPETDSIALNAGMVQLFSGATGDTLLVVLSDQSGVALGSSVVGVDDMDGDGDGDFFIGAPATAGPAGAGAGFAGLWSSRGPRVKLSLYSPNPVDTDFGSRVASVGDVNNDGWGDVAVGLPHDGSVFPAGGRVQVFSGRDGALLHDFTGIGSFFRLGWSVAGAGDIDGDGHADIVAGAPYPTAQVGLAFARVWSGRDGSVLLHYEGGVGDHLGTAVAGIGDVDGDGTPDLAIGAPNDTSFAGSVGRVHVVSGATGALIFDVHGPNAPSDFGGSLAAAGDVNGDGTPDLILGARNANTPTGGASGFARIVSGADGSTLHQFNGPKSLSYAGWAVAGIGDIDHDGAPDVAIGMPGAPSPTGSNSGVIELRSGADGTLLHTLWAWVGTGNMGHALAPAGDMDGDGTPDVAAGLPFAIDSGTNAGAVRIFSGATGTLIGSWAGVAAGNMAGHAVASAGDIDNDGSIDLVVGALGSVEHPGLAGGVHVVNPASIDTPWKSLGQVLPGSAGPPQLVGVGTLLPDEAVAVSLVQAAPLSSATLILGVSELSAPFLGGVLVPQPLLILSGLSTGPEGELLLSGPWPSGVPAGLELFAQVWIQDVSGPAGFAASNAVVGTAP